MLSAGFLRKRILIRSLDKITVTRLIEECHVSRQTFYYHFHDIMDVLEWTFKRSTQILVQKSLESEDRMAALKEFSSFVRMNRRKLKRLVESKRWFQIEGMMVDAVWESGMRICR